MTNKLHPDKIISNRVALQADRYDAFTELMKAVSVEAVGLETVGLEVVGLETVVMGTKDDTSCAKVQERRDLNTGGDAGSSED